MSLVIAALFLAMGISSIGTGLSKIADAIRAYPHIEQSLKEKNDE